MTINPKHTEWLNARGISEKTLSRMGIYSVRRGIDGALAPDSSGDVVVFPYISYGREQNAKYRGPGKKFWQKKDAWKGFYNWEANFDDAGCYKGYSPLVICEGELDCLSFIQAGISSVVSVPDGAPPARDQYGKLIPVGNEEIVIATDEKYSYIHSNWDELQRVDRFVLAGDGDEPGRQLVHELARRLGKAKCSFITYPEGCKDANDVLVKYGERAVRDLIIDAKRYPVQGLYALSDFPDEKPIRTYDIGFPGLSPQPSQPKAPSLSLYQGAFMVVSGLPGGGKTAWTTQLAFNMAINHNWRCAIASFEMPVTPTLRDMLRGFYLEAPQRRWGSDGIREADEFIQDKFSFISLLPDDDDIEADAQWVIDRAHDAVIRHGIKLLIVDPWNEVEHKRRLGENVADYTNRAIRAFKRFARATDVATIVVAHPTKSAGVANKNGEPVSLYDISDGATWANKAELGVIVSRKSMQDTLTEIGIRKVKFRGTGRLGDAYLTYDEEREAFVS